MEINLKVHLYRVLKKVNINALKMRLLTILFLFGFIVVNAASNPPRTKINLRLEDSTLKVILSSIEKSSDYIFIYNEVVLNSNFKRSVFFKDEDIENVLQSLFKGLDIIYKIDGRQVYISKRTKLIEEKSKQEIKKTKITGIVVDENDQAIIGASIMIKGTSFGTITDVNGRFSLETPDEGLIKISFIGYDPQLIAISGKTSFKISLNQSLKGLDEVVVVGYGIQKKLSTVASISQIKGDALEITGGVTNVSEQLQGMLPGLTVQNNSSRPGLNNTELFIRGKASWVSSSVLSLVDGVERDFNDIDPNEIETISILKDASATAVYGVKGANGVILITTKRGSLKKPEISFESSFGWKDPTTKPGYSDYVTSMNKWNEAATNDKQWSKLIPHSTIDAWSNAIGTGNYGPYNMYFPQIDWWDEIVQTGTSQKYNVNVSGGTDFVKYFTSLGYLDDGDIFKTKKNDLYDPAFGYKRYNWRTNFDFNLSKSSILTVRLSGDYGYRNQAGYSMYSVDDPNADTGNNQNVTGQLKFFQSIYRSPRNMFPITYPDGSYGLSSVGDGNLIGNLDMGQRTYKTYNNFIDLVFKQDLDFITKGLNFHAKLSYNSKSGTLTNIQKYQGGSFGTAGIGTGVIGYYRAYDYSKPLPDGGYTLLNSTRWPAEFQGTNPTANYDNPMQGGYQKKMLYEFGFDYAKSIMDHNFTLMALMNRIEDAGLQGTSSTSIAFPIHEESWVGRLTYNWKERYLAELNSAYTGSQKFAPGKRFGFFPSYALGWRISEEPFVKKLIGTRVINNLKVRYSSGIIGYDQSAPAFTYIQIYNNNGGGVSFGDVSKYTYGPLYSEGAPANPNATWETSYKQNLGFEIGLMNKLNFTLDLFNESRKGILMSVATPGWSGIAEPTGNVGEAKNHGFEMEMAWNDKIGKSVNYWLKANYTFSENRVVYRNDPNNLPDYLKSAGKPIGVTKNLIVAGFYNSLDDIYNGPTANNVATQAILVPGDFMYVDYNADGKIQDAEDMVPVAGVSDPLSTYGFSGGLSYKGFELTLVFYGVGQRWQNFGGNFLWDLTDGNSGNYSATTSVNQTWTPANASTATKPVLHSDFGSYSMRSGTTFSYQDASYIRLKNCEVSYNIQSRILKKFNIKKFQIYANGNNLFTFTNFNKSADPEQDGAGVYPIVKSYTTGLRLSF